VPLLLDLHREGAKRGPPGRRVVYGPTAVGRVERELHEKTLSRVVPTQARNERRRAVRGFRDRISWIRDSSASHTWQNAWMASSDCSRTHSRPGHARLPGRRLQGMRVSRTCPRGSGPPYSMHCATRSMRVRRRESSGRFPWASSQWWGFTTVINGRIPGYNRPAAQRSRSRVAASAVGGRLGTAGGASPIAAPGDREPRGIRWLDRRAGSRHASGQAGTNHRRMHVASDITGTP